MSLSNQNYPDHNIPSCIFWSQCYIYVCVCVFLHFFLTPDLRAHSVHEASAAREVNMHPLRLLPGVADSLWHTTKHISGHIICADHFAGDKEKSRPDNEPAHACTRDTCRSVTVKCIILALSAPSSARSKLTCS